MLYSFQENEGVFIPSFYVGSAHPS